MGGPKPYVDSVFQSGRMLGKTEGKVAMYPVLGVSCILGFVGTFIGVYATNYYRSKLDSVQAMNQAKKAEEELICGITEYNKFEYCATNPLKGREALDDSPTSSITVD